MQRCAVYYSLCHDVPVSVLDRGLQCNLQHFELIINPTSQKRQFTVPLAIDCISQRSRISLPSILDSLHNIIEVYHASSNPVSDNTSMTAFPKSLDSIIFDTLAGII